MACALAVFPGSGAAQDPPPLPRPDAIQQPLEDGCQRNPVGLLTFSSPEWVFVYSRESFNPDPARARVAEGRVAFGDTAIGDLPQNHAFYDYNADLELDPAYDYLAGGDPEDETGNFGEGGGLHIEWETGTLPPYAWATGEDRMKIWGSWVWDCGHWGQGFTFDPNDPVGSIVADTDYFLPGTNQAQGLRGEGTEFHPMKSVVVNRDRPADPVVGESQADVFMSSNGNTAGAESVCSLEHPPLTPIAYPPQWTLCVADPAKAHQPINDRDYKFFIPSPPKPSPDAAPRIRVVDRLGSASPPEQFVIRPEGVEVTVPFNGFGARSDELAYGKTFFVGWDGPVQDHPAKVEVELKRLTINNSLDDPEFGTSLGVPPGEWGLYSDINGEWNFLNEFAPEINAVMTGQNIDIDKTIALSVPAGDPLRIAVDGRECDLPRIQPCPITSELAEDNDSPGGAEDSYESVGAAVGEHTLTPDSGRWELTYEVRQVAPAFRDDPPPPGPGAGPQLSGPGCVDTLSPRSRASVARLRDRRRTIVIRGTAADSFCSERGEELREIEVAVARLQPAGRCRHLLGSGRLSRPDDCSDLTFLGARGSNPWALKIKRRRPLRAGSYIAHSRAIDGAGNIELDLEDESELSFRVRRR